MSVEDPSTVDFIGVEKDTGRIILTISDHLLWGGQEHFSTLERKIGAYVDFVESGQLLETRPDARDHPIEIRLVCQIDPSEEAAIFLDAVHRALDERGLHFSYKVLPTE